MVAHMDIHIYMQAHQGGCGGFYILYVQYAPSYLGECFSRPKSMSGVLYKSASIGHGSPHAKVGNRREQFALRLPILHKCSEYSHKNVITLK